MFVDKLLSLFICRGQGKINMKSWEAKIKKKEIYLSILSTSFPSLSSAWPSNSQQECGDRLFFSLSSKTRHCCHKSVHNKSVWRIPLRRRKTNKSRDCDLTDKMDLSDVFKRRAGLCDKRKPNRSGIWVLFFFFFSKIQQGQMHQDKHFRFRYCTSPWSEE